MTVLELALILVGAAVVGLGWYWGEVTDSRTTAIATGVPALLLAGVTIFTAASDGALLAVWAFAAAAAGLAGLAAAASHWEAMGDRALGLYALFFTAAAGLSTGGIANDAGEFTIGALGTLLAGVAGAMMFLSSALVPASRNLRRAVGWLMVFGGAGIVFIGYAPSVSVTF